MCRHSFGLWCIFTLEWFIEDLEENNFFLNSHEYNLYIQENSQCVTSENKKPGNTGGERQTNQQTEEDRGLNTQEGNEDQEGNTAETNDTHETGRKQNTLT